MGNSDATIARLQWFFRDSSADAQVPFLLAALGLTGHLLEIPKEAFDTAAIAKHRETRNRLLSMSQPHADVLAWMFEDRDWHPRIRTLFSWPGVAIRTATAQWALASDGRETVLVTSKSPKRRKPGLRPANAFMRHRGQWAPPDRHLATDTRPTGNHGSRGGVVGYLIGLDPKSDVVRAVREETSRRVSAALRAYEGARLEAA